MNGLGLGPCGVIDVLYFLLTLHLRCRGVPKKEFEGLERTLIVFEEVVIMHYCTVVDNEIVVTRFAANVNLITHVFQIQLQPFTFLARVWPFDPNGILRRRSNPFTCFSSVSALPQRRDCGEFR